MNDTTAPPVDEVTVVCPFCKGTVHARVTDKQAWIVHAEPTCRPFDEMAPENFFHEVYEVILATMDKTDQPS
jgi:hypothetical protein